MGESSFVYTLQSDADSPAMSLQLLHFGHLHDGGTDVPEALFAEMRTGDVLGEGGEVHSRILFCVSVCRWRAGCD